MGLRGFDQTANHCFISYLRHLRFLVYFIFLSNKFVHALYEQDKLVITEVFFEYQYSRERKIAMIPKIGLMNTENMAIPKLSAGLFSGFGAF